MSGPAFLAPPPFQPEPRTPTVATALMHNGREINLGREEIFGFLHWYRHGGDRATYTLERVGGGQMIVNRAGIAWVETSD